jgi:hypothetical protein
LMPYPTLKGHDCNNLEFSLTYDVHDFHIIL